MGEGEEAGRTPPKAPKALAVVAAEWRKLVPFFSLLDFAKRPDTQAGYIIRLLALSLAVFFLWKRVRIATFPLLSAHPPATIPVQEIDDYRFRLPERVRREIFTDLATVEIAERERAIKANTWTGHAWSREDDRGHFERVAARAAAAKYRISLTQVYLVLDEGIRNHWEGPDGKPLSATTPPHSIRTNSW